MFRVLTKCFPADMSTTDLVRVLGGRDDVLKACRPRSSDEGPLKPTDCRCIAASDSQENTWISSPNMEFVPELPLHTKGEVFTFYADGMLGAFELFKWPQVYDQREPHSMAAPANVSFIKEASKLEAPKDIRRVLPPFKDTDIPFLTIGPTEMLVTPGLPHLQVAMLQPELLLRFRAATEDTVKLVDPVWKAKYGHGVSKTPEEEREHVGRRHFILDRMAVMWRAFSKLEEVPMSPFNVISWTRELQRLLLEVRGWLIYEVVLAPRLRNPEIDGRSRPLPLRGVVTTLLNTVEDLYRIGVPVWWMREPGTLTNKTVIYKVRFNFCGHIYL